MRTPTAQAWADMCAELASTARRLAAEGPVLLRRSKGSAGEGFPTSSMGAGGGSSSAADPVGELVVARLLDPAAAIDPLSAGVAAMVTATWEAVLTLRQADEARAKASRPPPAANSGPAEVAACVVHARYGLQADARSRGRCRWCADWALAHDFADPPESAIRALEDTRIRRHLFRTAA